MIKVETEIVERSSEADIKASCEIEGNGADILDEAYGAIQAIIGSVKKMDLGLYQLLMLMLAKNSAWMCADEPEDKTRKRGKR